MDILRSLKDIFVCDDSVSTHELLHSGIIDGLHMFLTELRSVETISASVSPANSTDSRTSFEYHPQKLGSQHNSRLSDIRSNDFFRYKDRLCRIQSFLHIFFQPSCMDGINNSNPTSPCFIGTFTSGNRLMREVSNILARKFGVFIIETE